MRGAPKSRGMSVDAEGVDVSKSGGSQVIEHGSVVRPITKGSRFKGRPQVAAWWSEQSLTQARTELFTSWAGGMAKEKSHRYGGRVLLLCVS